MTLLSAAVALLLCLQEPARTGIQISDGGESVKLGETPAAFKGDASLSNGRISLVIPSGGVASQRRHED
jgi:hypothetical protein